MKKTTKAIIVMASVLAIGTVGAYAAPTLSGVTPKAETQDTLGPAKAFAASVADKITDVISAILDNSPLGGITVNVNDTSKDDTAKGEFTHMTNVIVGDIHVEGSEITLNNVTGLGGTNMVVIPFDDNAPLILDAVTGNPVKPADIQDGSTVVANVSDAMTMSLPPIINASVIFVNIPADYSVPGYVVADTTVLGADGNSIDVTSTVGDKFHITNSMLEAFKTKQAMNVADISKDTSMLIWEDANGAAIRVVVLPAGLFTGINQLDNAKSKL